MSTQQAEIPYIKYSSFQRVLCGILVKLTDKLNVLKCVRRDKACGRLNAQVHMDNDNDAATYISELVSL